MTAALIALLVAGGGAGIALTLTSRRRRRRVVNTTDARDDTKAQLTAMSDLILDLEPRVTIADHAGIRARYAEAARVYSNVLEQAEQAVSGHEVADLRIDIAKARWRLDVIDAELDGRTPPSEPHRRDNSGSAWDSTRGTGANPPG